MNDLAEKLNEYLKINGLKKQHLAKYLGLTPMQISRFLEGKYSLTEVEQAKAEDFLQGNHWKRVTE